ncbi:MAG: hypothetical protein J6Q54_03070, partial [Oscillospiraceae bacterium]|nr:hypothetical protein [Oscillospiraceae bacterium]
EGDTKEWDVSILTAEKSGKTLDYSVFMNGVEYTGSTISFSTADDYTIEYVITDSYNYNESGSAYPKEYTKTVEITVSVVKAAAKNATFDFGGNGYDEVTIGNDTYIMPTTGNSITINGTAVKYVLVNCEPSNGQYENSSMSYWNMIYPVFYEVITITDYADGGTGAAVTYGATTTSIPSGLTLAGSSNSSSLPSGAKSFSAETSAGKIFQYSSKGEAATSPTTFKIDNSNRLVYKSPQLSNNGRDEGWMLVRYQYQDNAGKIYYYVVCYHTPTMIEGSGGCVTPDTLVTLADGTQKEIQYVNYNDKLLVWNFYAGKYEVVPSAIIFNMGTGYFDVLTLNFEDGTTVKTIDGHRFFDKTTNAFVLINTINVQDYIGHDFVKVDGDSYTAVKLVDYSIENEYTTSYSIMSAYHYNFIVEGMFSDTFHKEDAPLFDYFQVGDNMMYDADQLQAEIAEYGLYTYEEFADYLTYEQFVALNVQYMKISVEKGQFTYEGILELIEKYLNA